MKTILVTGGNKGIGLEICRQLDAAGHRVILCSRDPERGKKAAGFLSNRVIVKQLDVNEEKSVKDLSAGVRASFGALDVLINNAGVGVSREAVRNGFLSEIKHTMESHAPQVWNRIRPVIPALRKAGISPPRPGAKNIPLAEVKQVMETNFYGPWRMIQVFLPLLEKSSDARIINISSGMGAVKSLTGLYPGYSLSKASLNALTIMFSQELKEQGIRVNAICPGWVRTDLGGPDAPRTVQEGADTAVWLATAEDIPTGKFFRDREEIEW